MEKDRNEELRNASRRILAVFAFVVVIALGIFGSLALASAVPGAFSGIASAIGSVFTPGDSSDTDTNEGTTPNDNEEITLSAPKVTVNEGASFTISWDHAEKTTEGVYTVRYNCVEDITFSFPTQSGSQTDVACDTAFNVGEATSVSVTPSSDEGEGENEVTFRVDYTPNGESVSTVSGEDTVTVARTDTTTGTGGGTGTTGSGGTVTTPIPGTGIGVSDPNGFVDLSVSLRAVGVVNRSTNQFFAVAIPSRSSFNERIAIQFEVRNNGTRTSPTWRFSANLPTAQNFFYNSPTQSALRPGESIVYTLAFDSFVNATSGTVTVNIDPSNIIAESNESNNRLVRVIQTNP